MIDTHTGTIEAAETKIVDRDEEIESCQIKGQGAHQIADKRKVHFGIQMDLTGQMAEFDSMLARTKENLDEYKQVLAVSLVRKQAEIANRDAKIEILERIVHDTDMVVKCKTEVAEKLAAALEDLQTKAMNKLVAEPIARLEKFENAGEDLEGER